MNSSASTLAKPQFKGRFLQQELTVADLCSVPFFFPFFSQNDGSNWEVDQSPEHQRYVFPRGPVLLGSSSYSCLTHLDRKPTHCRKTCPCVPGQVFNGGESGLVCNLVNNQDMSVTVTVSKDLGGYIFPRCWENGFKVCNRRISPAKDGGLRKWDHKLSGSILKNTQAGTNCTVRFVQL